MKLILKMFKKILEKVEKPVRLYFMFSVFDLLVGFVAMCFYGGFAANYGPVWVRNQFIGLWLTTLVFLISLQSIYIELKLIKRNLSFYFELIYIVSFVLISFLCVIFYGIAGSIDPIIWSIYLFAVMLTNCYIIILRTKDQTPRSLNLSNANDENLIRKKSADPNKKKNNRVLSVLNIINKFFSFVVLCFMLNSSIILGTGKLK